jgi:glycosyltransferase involved in cell wall biosynthesis
MSRLRVVIPAYNEEAVLPRTLDHLRDVLDGCGAEARIVVVDNRSTDRTADVARERGVDVVFEPVNQIARARNAGAAGGDEPWLLFVDADTLPPRETVVRAVRALASGTVCGGGALVEGDTPFTGFAAWLVRLWTWISLTRRLPAGSFVFCLREGFAAAGGFDETVYAGEEIWFARRLKRWGKRRGLGFELIAHPRVRTSSRKAAMFGSGQLLLQFLVLMAVPGAARSRTLCWVWYRRPKSKPG